MRRIRHSNYVLMGLLAFASVAPAAAAATGTAGELAPVYQFVEGVNHDDAAAEAAACAAPVVVVDDFAPHLWQGATACADWAGAFSVFARQSKITDNHITLGAPLHDDVTGDRAYVVFPATYTYKLGGKPTTENGAVWTLVLKKTAAGWRIAAWTWAEGH
ncbi:MAG: hypothetical protein JO219_10710 [Candidatus Eremiobacteraeota bacterium]|nr:hypothetical protein [Candidatus Eremiobacteraeota bacterium]